MMLQGASVAWIYCLFKHACLLPSFRFSSFLPSFFPSFPTYLPTYLPICLPACPPVARTYACTCTYLCSYFCFQTGSGPEPSNSSYHDIKNNRKYDFSLTILLFLRLLPAKPTRRYLFQFRLDP